MTIPARIGAVLLLACCAACSGLTSKTPAPQSFVLRSDASPVVAAGAVAPAARAVASLGVLRPQAAAGLAGTGVAVRLAGGRIDVYRGASWAADLEQQVQELAVGQLRQAAVARTVLDDAAPFAADWLLRIEILHCESDESAGGAPTVRVAWQVTLGRRADRTAVAGTYIERSVVADSRQLGAVVQAFRQATGQAAADLAQWSAGALAGAQ